MAQATAGTKLYSLEEYFALEERSDVKHEYLNGRIYPMSDGTPEHGEVAGLIVTELNIALKGKECSVYTSRVQIETAPGGLLTYPDVSVVCGGKQVSETRKTVVTNPLVIFEVLSPKTADYDRGAKFLHYQLIRTLKDYLVVYHDRPRIDHHHKHNDSVWVMTIVTDSDSSVQIPSLDFALRVSDVYLNYVFPPETPIDVEGPADCGRPPDEPPGGIR